ncbi:motility associated factor glycosyltransferase family protein [Desulfothermus sp.]
MNFYEANITCIKKSLLATFLWLNNNTSNDNNLALSTSKNKALRSKFYRTYKKGIIDKNTKLYIIIGSNLGYGILKLLENTTPLSKVVVIEPNPQILRACLTLNDYTKYINIKKLFFLPPDRHLISKFFDTLTPYIRYSKIKIHVDVPSSEMDETYLKLKDLVKSIIEQKILYINTSINMQEIFVKNELLNFNRIFKDRGLFPLKKNYRNLMGVIIGAGPSLNAKLPFLIDFKNNGLFVTAFQTLPALFKLRFQPHIAMVIDPSKILMQVYEKVDKNYLKSIPLFYSPMVDAEVIEKYPGSRYSIWTYGGVGTYINRNKDLVIDTKGNVSIGLIKILHEFGIKKFLLVGMDLAWRDKKTHVTGHHASNYDFSYNPDKHLKLKNMYNETIFSSPQYILAARELEDYIKNNNLEVYNLYGGGLVLEGTINIEEKQAIEILKTFDNSELKNFLRSLNSDITKRNYVPKIQLSSQEWIISLNHFEKRIIKLYKKLKNNQIKIRKAYIDLHSFLLQHPIYKIYLYNHILEISKYIFIKDCYSLEDLANTRKIIKTIKRKVKEVDAHLKNINNFNEVQKQSR